MGGSGLNAEHLREKVVLPGRTDTIYRVAVISVRVVILLVWGAPKHTSRKAMRVGSRGELGGDETRTQGACI